MGMRNTWLNHLDSFGFDKFEAPQFKQNLTENPPTVFQRHYEENGV